MKILPLNFVSVTKTVCTTKRYSEEHFNSSVNLPNGAFTFTFILWIKINLCKVSHIEISKFIMNQIQQTLAFNQCQKASQRTNESSKLIRVAGVKGAKSRAHGFASHCREKWREFLPTNHKALVNLTDNHCKIVVFFHGCLAISSGYQ